MTRSERLSFIAFIILVLAVLTAAVAIAMYDTAHAAPTDTCDPATTEQCCACEPAGAAEPAPLPHLYLPTVLQRVPAMSAEYTPAQPMQTPEPDVELPLGDASQ